MRQVHIDAWHEPAGGEAGRFLMRIAVTDLDPKRFTKIPTYKIEDDDIIRHYLECKQCQ